MRKFKGYFYLGGAVLLTAVLFACSKGKSDEGADNSSVHNDFKKGMLINYADNIITPAYNNLNAKLGALETAIAAFLAAPSTTTQDALRQPFKEAYISYEGVSVAYFGPAAALQLNTVLNGFPTKTALIESTITSGSYNLNVPAEDSIQGFPALDYLFFATDAITRFTGTGAAARKQYVQDVLARIETLVNGALSQWNGNYRNSFISSLQTNVGSSIGSLVNQFAYELDALKGPRIGWPFGKQSNGIVFADKCEGYYSGISASLAIANLTSLQQYYIGGSGDGIADYLVVLNKQTLNNQVLAQFDVALNALRAIPEPMSASFTNNAPLVEEAYRQVQRLLTLIKTDVASATAVQITYMDNDGD